MKGWNLTDEERKALVQMAAGQKPWNITYYAKALERIERGKLFSWNWAAALLSPMWLWYHKAFAISWIVIATGEALGFFIGPDEGACAQAFTHLLQTGQFSSELRNMVYWLLSEGILYILFFGLFGNRLIFSSLRRKRSRGYDKLPHYSWTESRWIWLASGLLVGWVALSLFIISTPLVLDRLQGLLFFGGMILILAVSTVGILLYKTVIRPIRDGLRARKLQKSIEEFDK